MPDAKRYGNFDLLVSTGDHARYLLRVLAAPGGGETAEPAMAPRDELQALTADIDAWRAVALDRSRLRALGAALMAWLFRGPVLQLYRTSLARLGPEEGMRVRLRIEPAELHGIPWECCYDTQQEVFLAQDLRTPFVRYLLGTFNRSKLADARLKVLVAVASPRGLPPLHAEDEYARIEDALDELGGRVEICRTAATLDGLQDALRRGPNVLHFIGHGGFDPDAGGYIVVDDGQGGPQMADAEVLAGYLRGSSVRLAILNACESARTDPTDSFAGVVPRLVQAGLPAVIAMQTFLTDEAAVKFARAFYRALADGWPLDAAVTASRQALFGHSPESSIWSIPVLYLSAPDGILWEAEEMSPTANVASPPTPTGPSNFQFNFRGPATINAAVVGGNQYVTQIHKGSETPTDEPAADRIWNTATLRDLLTAGFSDGELTTLCFDHFSAVYEDFAVGMSKSDKIQRLLDHCIRYERVETLLSVVREANPVQYRRYEGQLRR